MREALMRVRLVVSPWMDARGEKENTRIRIPKRGRHFFEVKNNKVTLRGGEQDLYLEVRQARREDVLVLLEEVKDGDITSEQADITAFVTSETRARFLKGRAKKKEGEELYLTDRIDALKIGADPEFALVDPGTLRFMYAQKVPGLKKDGQLGEDGPLAEVRPPPEKNNGALVDSIRKILQKNKSKIEQYHWLGGATYKSPDRTLSIGGHIHIGDPPLLPVDRRNAAHQRVIQILDELVAMPLVRVDSPDQQLRRGGKEKYGLYGDQRPQEGRFEWRVPSGWWLVHPELANAVLGTTKAISEACYQKMADAEFELDYIAAPANRKGLLKDMGALAKEKVEKLVNGSNPDLIDTSIIDRTKSKLTELPNYQQYKGEIDAFIEIIQLSDNDRKNVRLDLKENWLENKSFIK